MTVRSCTTYSRERKVKSRDEVINCEYKPGYYDMMIFRNNVELFYNSDSSIRMVINSMEDSTIVSKGVSSFVIKYLHT